MCVAGTRKWSPVSGLVGGKHSRKKQKEKAACSLSAVQVVLPSALSLWFATDLPRWQVTVRVLPHFS